MANSKEVNEYLGPSHRVHSEVMSAIQSAYQKLSEQEKTAVLSYMKRMLSKNIEGFGITSALELSAKVGVFLEGWQMPMTNEDLRRISVGRNFNS